MFCINCHHSISVKIFSFSLPTLVPFRCLSVTLRNEVCALDNAELFTKCQRLCCLSVVWRWSSGRSGLCAWCDSCSSVWYGGGCGCVCAESGAAVMPPEHPQAMPDIIEEVCGDVFDEAASMVSGPATLEEPSLTVSCVCITVCRYVPSHAGYWLRCWKLIIAFMMLAFNEMNNH